MNCLLLPGMTLNSTAFPSLALPCRSVDFNDLVLSADGSFPPDAPVGMALYEQLLTQRIGSLFSPAPGPEIVVAHSFGGMLALQWTAREFEQERARVRSLVLIATTAGPMFGAARLRFALAGQHFRIPLSGIMRLWNRPAVTRFVKRRLSGGRLTAEPVDFGALANPTDWTVDRAGWRNTDWRAMRSFRQAMDGFDVRNRLHRIGARVIVLHGSDDSLFPVSVAEELAEGLPSAELSVIDGAGHALPLTHGDEVVKAVEELAEL